MKPLSSTAKRLQQSTVRYVSPEQFHSIATCGPRTRPSWPITCVEEGLAHTGLLALNPYPSGEICLNVGSAAKLILATVPLEAWDRLLSAPGEFAAADPGGLWLRNECSGAPRDGDEEASRVLNHASVQADVRELTGARVPYVCFYDTALRAILTLLTFKYWQVVLEQAHIDACALVA